MRVPCLKGFGGQLGEGIVDLLVPETIGNMPGLLTGMIIGESPESFYVANLGDALIKVSVKQPQD